MAKRQTDVPNPFTAQSACFVLMSHVCPSRAFEHGRWVSMMACLSHPSLTAPSMQNYACAAVAAAQGQVLFWESKGARDAMIALLCELVWIWMSAKSLRGKMTMLTSFSEIVALFNKSALCVQWEICYISRMYSGIYMMPVSFGKCNTWVFQMISWCKWIIFTFLQFL